MEKRFFAETENFHDGVISLFCDEHHHLKNVLRLKKGDKVECFSPDSPIYSCCVKEILKDKTLLEIKSFRKCFANPRLDVTLFQALIKPDKFEFLTQKFCELGGGEIIPFSSQFSVTKASSIKAERLSKIIISACKQCGRTRLLKVTSAVKFGQMLEALQGFHTVLFANEREATVPLKTLLPSLSSLGKIALIVGSEGGFSPEETALLNAKKNVFSLSLGRRILRAETAATALSACVFAWLEQ